ncbi:pyruvate formate lyase family protein, partial [Pseudostreptobacillus hongkongensis]|uniref:pyruvate formate lyase family protein n=1 Tax=Pseudostreptobacillus hongkongensis TaxID=1162717 RepID=UPI000A5F60B3
LYLADLAATKDQTGAAMRLGRTSTYLDIDVERELQDGKITEKVVQELIDQFVVKLSHIRFLRTPKYDALFSGDPTWVTETVGGMLADTHSLIT